MRLKMGKLINWIDLFSIATWIIWVFFLSLYWQAEPKEICPICQNVEPIEMFKTLGNYTLSQQPLVILLLYCIHFVTLVIVNFFHYLHCFSYFNLFSKWMNGRMNGIIIAITMIKCRSHNVLNRIEYGSFTTNRCTRA